MKFTFAQPDNQIRVLLLDATNKKSAGDVVSAIKCLRQAYKRMPKSPIFYGIEVYLRLPMYLQAAGLPDEALLEFQNLIDGGYPTPTWASEPDLVSMQKSRIYDKMRLFMQRESRNDDAIKFGVLSYLSWAKGLQLQNRKDELASFVARDSREKTLKKLLKKAGRTQAMSVVIPIVENAIKRLPSLNSDTVARSIDESLLTL